MNTDVFGKRLAELRKEKGITQTELSKILDIQRVTIAKYETGERAPSIDNLISFAEYFDVPTDYLLGLSKVKSYDGLNRTVIAAFERHIADRFSQK